MSNVALAGGQWWTVLARLMIQSWAHTYESDGGSVAAFEANLKTYLENRYGRGCVGKVIVYVEQSWLATDALVITFTFKPAADVPTGDVSIWKGVADLAPAFSPPDSLSYTIFRAANKGGVGPFTPYRKTVPFTLSTGWYDTLVVDKINTGDKLFDFFAGTNPVASAERVLNNVQTSNPLTTDTTAGGIIATQTAASIFSWDIVPEWARIVLIAAPVILVGGVTLFAISKAVGAVRAIRKGIG